MERCDALEDDSTFYEANSFPRTKNSRSDYHTFANSLDNSQDFRTRSLSVPYVSCNVRTYKRTMSTYDRNANSDSDKRKTKSLGNLHSVNGNDYTVDFAGYKNESEQDQETSGRLCGFSRRQVKCGAALLFLSFTDVMGFSIFAPFFPIVAEQKNLNPIHIGVIFAAFSMAGIFASIITGTLLVKVGAKFIILSGIFWSAGATICFGLLEMVSEDYFFILCLLCRLMMGIGSASAFTAIFAVIFKEFSERSLTMIGISESLCSIGGILGPLLGGALYDYGGFIFPFMFLGCTQLLVLFMCCLMVPSVAVEKQINTVSPARLLLNSIGFFAAVFVAISFTINSFLIANISQFLTHSFNMSAFMVGVFMLVFSIFYGASTPVWGYIADTKNCGALMMALSGVLSGITLAFFGPSDFIRHWFGWSGPTQWLVYLTVSLLGVLMGAMIMPTFGEMLIAAKQMKLHSNALAEYGLVSGLWNTVFSVGDILGPTLGGVLVQKYDFENTCTILGACLSIVGILKIIHLIVLACRNKQDEDDSSEGSSKNGERDSLISKQHPSVQA